ncbi:MAG TPA: DUF86 domain-containing protein [Aggregatilineales bacterium]|jgi:uncharacterized protein with HEPN domain|nr:DUF86 domain-containing protein [Chloroflexota bacterium]HOA23610.1 DUF86 domain-containing protein [Aggregatilineales bacterium]HPV08759.1 DUF86 domain-containing protein [Aggregatilineales bacterium]HQA67681.1 DUF86 domain-containing protein [Aggregatilineales bacterium]HQE17093.1 DUF86 domain-containing protein [Aggregatilineales bacterium]
MNKHDRTRLLDMLDAARKAQAFAAGRSREDLDSDEMFAFALTRALEIIGEAAARVSQETRADLPQIPWRSIIGMRNKLIHDYIAVDYDILWATVETELDTLISHLEKSLEQHS